MTSPAMPPGEAAWVREHAWLPAMREEHELRPHLYSQCPCQYETCEACAAGEHHECARPTPKTSMWSEWRADVPISCVSCWHTETPLPGDARSWCLWDANVTHHAFCPCALNGHAVTAAPEQGELFSLPAA